jgi:hypothetical protein
MMVMLDTLNKSQAEKKKGGANDDQEEEARRERKRHNIQMEKIEAQKALIEGQKLKIEGQRLALEDRKVEIEDRKAASASIAAANEEILYQMNLRKQYQSLVAEDFSLDQIADMLPQLINFFPRANLSTEQKRKFEKAYNEFYIARKLPNRIKFEEE